MKKTCLFVSLLIATLLLVLSCGGGGDVGGGAATSKPVVLWTFNEDLVFFVDLYKEKTGKTVDVTIIQNDDGAYRLKTEAAMQSGTDTPDMIVGEADWLLQYYEYGYLEDLNIAPYNIQQYKDLFVDYVWEASTDSKGITRAVTYQIAPGAIYYRRDIAKTTWGDDSPDFVSSKLSSLDNMLNSARELAKAGNYKILPNGYESLRRFDKGIDPKPWVLNGALQMTEDRLKIMDIAKAMYQENLIAHAPEWSPAYIQGIDGVIPIDIEGDGVSDGTGEIFAYTLPTWGLLYVVAPNAKSTTGKWGLAKGPSSYFWGGTYLGINKNSKNKEAAWDFLKFVAIDGEAMEKWAVDKTDVISQVGILEKLRPQMTSPVVAEQNFYDYFLEVGQDVDYSLITMYDFQIDSYFGQAVAEYQEGRSTKEQALKTFYQNIQSVYPEIKLP